MKLLTRREYQTLNLIKVNGRALKKNFTYFQKDNPQAKIAPVLKSNAYGHGLTLVGRFISQNLPQAPFLVVDSLYEAWELEKAGVCWPTLVIGYTKPTNFKISRKLRFHLPLFDRASATVLANYQPQTKLHLKIDTGMNRLGIKPDQVDDFIKVLRKLSLVDQVVGIYSHLSCAGSNAAYTHQQVNTFKKVIHQFESAGFCFTWKHIAASAGATLIKDQEFNLIRLGLGFYGYSPLGKDDQLSAHLHPALCLTSQIAQIKLVSKGELIGYHGWPAPRDMKIGILPIGYFDGLDRRLSNQGLVKVAGRYCPIIGQVCMNITMIDLSLVPSPRVGQKVIIIDPDPASRNSLATFAKQTSTIPYDLLVSLSSSTRRRLV